MGCRGVGVGSRVGLGCVVLWRRHFAGVGRSIGGPRSRAPPAAPSPNQGRGFNQVLACIRREGPPPGTPSIHNHHQSHGGGAFLNMDTHLAPRGAVLLANPKSSDFLQQPSISFESPVSLRVRAVTASMCMVISKKQAKDEADNRRLKKFSQAQARRRRALRCVAKATTTTTATATARLEREREADEIARRSGLLPGGVDLKTAKSRHPGLAAARAVHQ
jgi:hypothetical protein